MAKTSVTIAAEVGLHARPAAKFVKTATTFSSDIVVRNGERIANAKSMVQILTLEAGQGAVIEIEATGPDEIEALAALTALLDHV